MKIFVKIAKFLNLAILGNQMECRYEETKHGRLWRLFGTFLSKKVQTKESGFEVTEMLTAWQEPRFLHSQEWQSTGHGSFLRQDDGYIGMTEQDFSFVEMTGTMKHWIIYFVASDRTTEHGSFVPQSLSRAKRGNDGAVGTTEIFFDFEREMDIMETWFLLSHNLPSRISQCFGTYHRSDSKLWMIRQY